MMHGNDTKINQLIEKGVKIPSPLSIEIGDEVDIDRISGQGVTIHSGSKIFGASTYISKNTQIGYEGPVTIENCWIAPEVELKGGFFKKSVFLNKVSLGFGAHIREGTILEEEASTAHTVGLKQTILFPFVTLGSLINFCDCFMAGGTSRKNHSEVGSSYIHFNYTPNQDKATASLIGDVPKGVMLNNNPIFLGGQGGLVGPSVFNYGTVIAAGTIQRKDETNPDRLLFGGGMKRGSVQNTPGIYQNVKKIVGFNINYIGNLIALMNWYEYVRSRFVCEELPEEILKGLKLTLDLGIDERIKRLTALKDKFLISIQCLIKRGGSGVAIKQQQDFVDNWDKIEETLMLLRKPENQLESEAKSIFLERLDSIIIKEGNEDYISIVKGFDEETSLIGTKWLQEIVDRVKESTLKIIPEYY